NDANEDTGNTDSAFVDIQDEQNNDDSDLSIMLMQNLKRKMKNLMR
nr:hypothetical protein [Tanacetum cinerariifolium]